MSEQPRQRSEVVRLYGRRIGHILEKHDITTIAEAKEKSSEELQELPGIGETSAETILNKQFSVTREIDEDVKRYFIKNKGGAIHEVTYEEAKELLKRQGYRMAKPDEIKAYKNTKYQYFDAPIAEPWDPEPEPEPEPAPAE